MGRYWVSPKPRFRRPLRNKQVQRKRRAENHLKSAELRWMDQLLRSFQKETPVDWLPAQYHNFFCEDPGKKPTYH